MPPNNPENQIIALETFTVVAKKLSFIRAAEELRISASALSRRITQLEESLETRLFERSTRRVSLTEAGNVYLKFVTEALSHIADGKAAISDLTAEPIGRLKVSMPNVLGQLKISPLLSGFLKKYPKLKLDLTLIDRHVDLIDEGYDLVIRMGSIKTSSLKAIKLADNHRILCASPEYLAENGSPASASDLINFACLQYDSSENYYQLQNKKRKIKAPVSPVVISDNVESLRQLTLSGCGISLLSKFLVSDDLQAGRLIQILPNWSGRQVPIWILFHDSQFIPLKVRVFIDYIIAQFKNNFV